MQHQDEDLIKARILEAEMALEPASPFLETDPRDLVPGERTQAEAFIANAPSLYGYERDQERIFMALDIAVSAIQADPTFGGGYALAAACIYRLGVKDVDIYDSRALTAAIPWAFRAIKMEPEYDTGWEIYIECHCFKGDFATAEGALGEVYTRFGDNDLYARAAFLYFRLMGDTAQALNWGALAWQTEWDHTRLIHTLFSLGQLYRDVGEWGKAADTYRVITERDHENAWAFHYAARCLSRMGDFDQALDLNYKAIKLGQLHEFRSYQEELKKLKGRARLGGGRVTNVGTRPPQVVAAPPAVAPPVVAAPPPKSERVVAAPPPAKKSTRLVAAPPPAKPVTKKVAAPPPAKQDVREMKAPPAQGSTRLVAAPPPVKPDAPTRLIPRPPAKPPSKPIPKRKPK